MQRENAYGWMVLVLTLIALALLIGSFLFVRRVQDIRPVPPPIATVQDVVPDTPTIAINSTRMAENTPAPTATSIPTPALPNAGTGGLLR